MSLRHTAVPFVCRIQLHESIGSEHGGTVAKFYEQFFETV